MGMVVDDFREKLLSHLNRFGHTLATETGDWVVKGFIDVYRNIYTISVDTKVISKIIELMLFPVISQFASEHSYKMVLSEHQNHYPDISLIASDETKIALDFKSTYRVSADSVNGFTLGAFTGYFRNRASTKNVTFSYEQYKAHFVLGVIYSRSDEATDERQIYTLDDLQDIVSVVEGGEGLLRGGGRMSSQRAVKGGTKNIGSVKNIGKLIEGSGIFSSHSQEIFDDYWRHYLTNDMAQAIESEVPYRNLKEYLEWRIR